MSKTLKNYQNVEKPLKNGQNYRQTSKRPLKMSKNR